MTSCVRACALCLVATLLSVRTAAGQSAYYNLDSGRPTRVEDALPTPRGELEIQFLPLRAEWMGDGSQRQRFEPKLSYGVLPMTEIEVRLPIVRVQTASTVATTGVASAAIGGLHAFNVETRWPALAVAGEAVLPVGSLSAATASYAVKMLMSKTYRFARVELNAGGGSWAIRLPKAGPVFTPNQCGDPGQPPCLPPDVPCDVAPAANGIGPSFACAPSSVTALPTAATPGQRPSGAHWTAALGVDHTLPLVSTLLAATISVDRFDGLYTRDDWTAEVGLRRQLAPQLVGDLGVGRRFAGTTQSTSVSLGLTYSAPLRWLW
jgi:hypothetical protein